MTKGLQEIAAESSDYSKKAFAAGSGVVEKLLGASRWRRAIQIQTEYVKSAYEGFVAEASQDQRVVREAGDRGVQAGRDRFAKAQGK